MGSVRGCEQETISKLTWTVTLSKAGVQKSLKYMDSRFRGDDDQRSPEPF
jgi:hypothetical protein